MRLHEIEITKKFKQLMTGEEISTVLRSQGWQNVHFGKEGGVAEHPRGRYMLKIFPQHSAYGVFVQSVGINNSNPHLPKFLSAAKTIPGSEYRAVRMEKLMPMGDYDFFSHPSLMCLVQQIYDRYHLTSPYWAGKNVTWNNRNKIKIDCNSVEIDRQERQAFELLDHIVRAYGWADRLDLHEGNFMARGSTWVVTDPFF
jgi:hypothetical protein